MLRTQNNLLDAVTTSACSSSSIDSYNIHAESLNEPNLRQEHCSLVKAESSPSNVDYNDEASPKSDGTGNGPLSASSPLSACLPTYSTGSLNAITPRSPAAPVSTNGDTKLSLNSSLNSQALSASEAASAIASLTARNQHSNLLFGTQVHHMDLNSIFGKFFSGTNLSPTNSLTNDRKTPTTPPQFDSQLTNGVDATTFLQLSHLLTKQQQAADLVTKSPTPQMDQKSGTVEQRFQRSQAASRQDSVASTDRRKSYPYTFQYCVLCQKNVHSSKLPCHIRQCHVGKPMFQCPACDFTSTYSKNNVKSHMVSLHGLAGDPISYMDQYAGQVEDYMKKCFPNVRGRGRPVHGRLSPSQQTHHSNRGGNQQQDNADSLIRRNSSPFSLTQINNLRTKIEFSDNEFNNNKSHLRNKTASDRLQQQQQQQHLAAMASIPQQQQPQLCGNSMSASTAAGATNPSSTLLAQQVARFNEIYAMAMMGGKAPLGEKFASLLNNNKIDFSLQNANANPLFYLQQLSQLNAAANGGFLEKNGIKAEEEEEKSIGEEIAYSGIEQILDNIHRTLEGNENHSIKNETNNVGWNGKLLQMRHNHGQNPTQPPSRKRKLSNEPCASICSLQDDDDTLEPLYLPQPLRWRVLDGKRLENTIFNTFTNSYELVEKLDLTPFEALLDKSNVFLNSAQIAAIREVREKIGLKSFEIMFAVHRLDLQILTPENVRLVLSIAPADVDIRRFAMYEQHNSASALTDDEQFIIQLSKIDRLREKLNAMDFMGSFVERLAVLNQQISDVSAAAKTLEYSSEFHTILQLILAFGNLILGDFNSQLVQGFRPSSLLDMCIIVSNTVTDTIEEEDENAISLIEILAERIVKCFAHLSNFCAQCKIVNEASKVNLTEIDRQIRQLEHGVKLVETELVNNGSNNSLYNFIVQCESEIAQIRDSFSIAKKNAKKMLQFFGELPSEFDDKEDVRPESFFAAISEFARRLDFAIARHRAAESNAVKNALSPTENSIGTFSH